MHTSVQFALRLYDTQINIRAFCIINNKNGMNEMRPAMQIKWHRYWERRHHHHTTTTVDIVARKYEQRRQPTHSHIKSVVVSHVRSRSLRIVASVIDILRDIRNIFRGFRDSLRGFRDSLRDFRDSL